MSLRREVAHNITIPDAEFPHSPDLFLALVLPFMTGIEIVERPLTGYVYHGDNVGLFRSSAANRALYKRQLATCRRCIETEHGRRFVCYAGRSMYGSDTAEPVGLYCRLGLYAREALQIGLAQVPVSIKLRSQAKLLASSALPEPGYRALQHLRSSLKSRSFLTKSTFADTPQKAGG
jgi:hypothetical protein